MTTNMLATYWRASTPGQFLIAVFGKFQEARGLQTAASLTFTSLLALVPLLTVVLMVTSQLDAFASIGVEVRNFLVRYLLPERAGRVIATYALQFSQKASNLTFIGITLLVLTAVMLLQTIDRTLNAIWEIRHPAKWYVRLPTYWVVLTLGPLVLGFGIFLTAQLVAASLDVFSEPRWVRSLTYTLVAGTMMSALFAYLFHAVPRRKLKLAHSIVGGLVAGVGAMLVQRLFGLYLAKLPNFTLVYGTFSVLPLFLLWLHASWCAVLLGASVAAILPDFATRRRLLPDTPLGRFQAGLRLLQALTDAQHAGHASTLETLANASSQTHASTEAMLVQFAEAAIAARTESGDWLLCTAGEKVTLGDLMNVLLLDIPVTSSDALAVYLRGTLNVPAIKAQVGTQIG